MVVEEFIGNVEFIEDDTDGGIDVVVDDDEDVVDDEDVDEEDDDDEDGGDVDKEVEVEGVVEEVELQGAEKRAINERCSYLRDLE